MMKKKNVNITEIGILLETEVHTLKLILFKEFEVWMMK